MEEKKGFKRSAGLISNLLVISCLMFFSDHYLKTAYGGERCDHASPQIYQHQSPLPFNAVDDEGYTIWKTEGTSSCEFSDHQLEINVDVSDPKNSISDLSLIVNAFDVDFTDDSGVCEDGPEVDLVSINNYQLPGKLRGASDSWSTTTFKVDPSKIKEGINTVFIDTDSTGTDCWCLGIGYVALRGKVGFQIVNTTPPNDAEKVDYDRPNITVTFSGKYDTSTVNADTFEVFF